MKIQVILAPILVGLAFGGGWVASSYVNKPSTVAVSQNQQTTTPKADDTAPKSSVYDVYSGNGLTTDELYQTLDKLTGTDFDKRYINYTILLQGYIAGLNRLAKDRAVAPALKERATLLYQQDTQRMDDFFALQKQLGYTHH